MKKKRIVFIIGIVMIVGIFLTVGAHKKNKENQLNAFQSNLNYTYEFNYEDEDSEESTDFYKVYNKMQSIKVDQVNDNNCDLTITVPDMTYFMDLAVNSFEGDMDASFETQSSAFLVHLTNLMSESSDKTIQKKLSVPYSEKNGRLIITETDAYLNALYGEIDASFSYLYETLEKGE